MLSSHAKNVAVLSILYLAGSVAGLGFLVYQTQEMGVLLEEQTVIIANNNVLKQRQIELMQLLRQTEKERAQLTSYLLTEDKTIDFLTEIEQAARGLGLTFETDALRVTEREGEFNDLIVRFSFSGSERSVKDMLQIFESVPYHGQVTRLEIRRESESAIMSSELELQVSLLSS